MEKGREKRNLNNGDFGERGKREKTDVQNSICVPQGGSQLGREIPKRRKKHEIKEEVERRIVNDFALEAGNQGR